MRENTQPRAKASADGLKPSLHAIVEPLLDWYGQNARVLPWRENREPYRVWVSEIMLQQTRVEAVLPYYRRFLAELPDVASLAQAEEEWLLKLWEGLGYYSRARNLQKAAQVIVKDYGGRFPSDYQQVLALPGIGAYTAGAICSIAFEQPQPAVDGNVLRLLSRVQADDSDISLPPTRRRWQEALAAIYPTGRCGDFTQSLMELGALLCLPNGAPLCDRCPLKGLCLAEKQQRQGELPIKAPKKARRQQELTVFLLQAGEKIALCRRQEQGLLAGLWEFPHTEGQLSAKEATAYWQARGLSAQVMGESKSFRHIFTHIEWQMLAYVLTCDQPAGAGLTWISQQELEEKAALPTAFRKVAQGCLDSRNTAKEKQA